MKILTAETDLIHEFLEAVFQAQCDLFIKSFQ